MKTVNLPIQVPNGHKCWDGNDICDKFDNEGGRASCSIGFHIESGFDYKKPKECIALVEV